MTLLTLLTLGTAFGAPATSAASAGDAVVLDVRFKLTDLDYQPLPGTAVRLVFGSDADWQAPSSGYRFVTDANGEQRVTAAVRLDKRLRKVPTNFVSSLLSLPQNTDHLTVAAELEYLSFHWLYAVDICRFPGGEVMLDGFTIYSAGTDGRFTQQAAHDEHGWRIADLGGMVLTTPGHEAWDFMLQPDPSDPALKHWTLQLAFKRAPPPIRR